MKAVAFNGSARPKGNTARAVEIVFGELKKEGIDGELVNIGGKPLAGCTGCNKCKANKDMKCALKDDGMNSYIEKMASADAIIIASPVYYGNVTASVKALIERCGQVARANDSFFKA